MSKNRKFRVLDPHAAKMKNPSTGGQIATEADLTDRLGKDAVEALITSGSIVELPAGGSNDRPAD